MIALQIRHGCAATLQNIQCVQDLNYNRGIRERVFRDQNNPFHSLSEDRFRMRAVKDMVREEIELLSLEGRHVVLMLAIIIQNIQWNSVVLGTGDRSFCFI